MITTNASKPKKISPPSMTLLISGRQPSGRQAVRSNERSILLRDNCECEAVYPCHARTLPGIERDAAGVARAPRRAAHFHFSDHPRRQAFLGDGEISDQRIDIRSAR